jgi:hypothetical protein
MFGLTLMRKFCSPVIYLLSLLIISSQAHLTAETMMQKEMEWAKSSMEKHHKSRGHLPLRSPESRAELYPLPNVEYDEDESFTLEPDK